MCFGLEIGKLGITTHLYLEVRYIYIYNLYTKVCLCVCWFESVT